MNLAQELEVQEVTKNINTKNAATQIETLHPNADKYITVATIDENGKYQQRHLIIEELMENLDKLVSLNRNTYISVNVQSSFVLTVSIAFVNTDEMSL